MLPPPPRYRRARSPARVVRSLLAGIWRRSAAALLLVVAAGEAHRIFDALQAVLLDLCIAQILVGRQELFEQHAELHLAPGAARLHIAEHALEVADAGRERLHLAEPRMHAFELFLHRAERFRQPLVQAPSAASRPRSGASRPAWPRFPAGSHRASFDRQAQRLLRRGLPLRQDGQFRRDLVEPFLLLRAEVFRRRRQHRRGAREAVDQVGAQVARGPPSAGRHRHRVCSRSSRAAPRGLAQPRFPSSRYRHRASGRSPSPAGARRRSPPPGAARTSPGNAGWRRRLPGGSRAPVRRCRRGSGRPRSAPSPRWRRPPGDDCGGLRPTPRSSKSPISVAVALKASVR